MKRRSFLLQSSLTLAALGLNEAGLSLLAQRYQRVLAAPTSRKLALLVGINQYHTAPLAGCVTDVELQRELLMYRFGFPAGDILTLTDQQATRSAIEAAFQSHLVEQARSGDVVVFHFSGYGGLVSQGETTQPSLVTVDEPRSSGDGLLDGLLVDDLLEETLRRRLRSLQTNKITTILDTSYRYSGRSLQGNLRIRARPTRAIAQLSQSAIAFQTPLLEQSDRTMQPEPIPGVMLAATAGDRVATEAHWNGFSAGVFTYALTQQLWQATPATTVQVLLASARAGEPLADRVQEPPRSGPSIDPPLTERPYFLSAIPEQGADGVVIEVEDTGKAKLWLGGLSAALLEQYSVNSVLAIAAAEPSLPTYLQMVSREGLVARAKAFHWDSPIAAIVPFVQAESVQVGQFVRERVRVLPRNINLTVALDPSLERIERIDAVSAFSSIPRVSIATTGDQSADYLFSKNAPPTQVAALPTALSGLVNSSVSQSSYGLFSLAQEEIPNTIGESGEAVKLAVRRLLPKLHLLLAAKLLSLTVNEHSSQLPVRVALEHPDAAPALVSDRQTALPASAKATVTTDSRKSPERLQLPVGSPIQYRLENYSTEPLYPVLMGLDTGGNLIALHLPRPATDPHPAIAVGEALILPQPATPQWVLHGPLGLAETYVLLSRSPFTQTVSAIETALRSVGESSVLHPLSNPLEVAQAVLQDLHQAGGPTVQAIAAPDNAVLDMTAWVSFRFVYQIIS